MDVLMKQTAEEKWECLDKSSFLQANWAPSSKCVEETTQRDQKKFMKNVRAG
jgi:hypothetical protein